MNHVCNVYFHFHNQRNYLIASYPAGFVRNMTGLWWRTASIQYSGTDLLAVNGGMTPRSIYLSPCTIYPQYVNVSPLAPEDRIWLNTDHAKFRWAVVYRWYFSRERGSLEHNLSTIFATSGIGYEVLHMWMKWKAFRLVVCTKCWLYGWKPRTRSNCLDCERIMSVISIASFVTERENNELLML